MLHDIFYLRHERVTRKMTITVSNVSVCYTFFRERNNGRIRSWPRSATDPSIIPLSRSATDPSIIPLSEEGVTHRNVGDCYCHLSRHPFVSQIKYILLEHLLGSSTCVCVCVCFGSKSAALISKDGQNCWVAFFQKKKEREKETSEAKHSGISEFQWQWKQMSSCGFLAASGVQ